MSEEARGRPRIIALLALLASLALLAGCASSTGANATNTPASGQASTPTATPRAMDCQISQIAATFRIGEASAGDMFATIYLRNISAEPCALEGEVGFYGVDASGARIKGTGMNQPVWLMPVVLPPHTPAPPLSVSPTPGAYVEVIFIGAYRDDPTNASGNGLCSAANEVTPARFVVSIGTVTMRVANDDPQSGRPDLTSVEGCHGVILGESASHS
ncbi:MAG TPA: hypothetical protein VF808_04110 [Ktedonobacterales bacterium]